MLSSTRVNEILIDCLFRPNEIGADDIPLLPDVKVEGITMTFYFHKGRLENHRIEIQSLLLELPNEFMETGGGGYSFLKACYDRKGRQWGEHRNMEALFCLGIGINKVAYCMPRDVWEALPGSVPYLIVKDKSWLC